jgi:hypothetical protein
MTEIELVRLMGAFCGGFIGGLALILKVVIPRTIGNQINSKIEEVKTNELKHVQDKLTALSETTARLDERLKTAEGHIKRLFQRLDDHINGAKK